LPEPHPATTTAKPEKQREKPSPDLATWVLFSEARGATKIRVESGKIVWQSLGFAPRACTSPTAANGRLFFSPNVNNMLYCFEPIGEVKK
jgi:hypothetical protein